MTSKGLLALAVFAFTALAHAEVSIESLPSWQNFYLQHYPLTNEYQKLVDNHGDGYAPLYGVRNFREVLKGIVYRGGANNAYNKYGKRSNSNPLPNMGLKNLCDEGFGTAVYLYSTNYGSAPKTTNCTSIRGGSNTLSYIQKSGLDLPQAQMILQMVYDRINGSGNGPIYVHCWNGWHASGFVSALMLRQFCGFTGDQAVNYWNKNTDGNDGSAYEGIRKKIRNFTPMASLMIPASTAAKICPAP